MALITCIECGKEISDKAVSCPHCGFPLEKEPVKEEPIICLIQGKEYDLTPYYFAVKQREKRIIMLVDILQGITGFDYAAASNLLKYLRENEGITPSSYNFEKEPVIIEEPKENYLEEVKKRYPSSEIVCPYCKGTNISKIGSFRRTTGSNFFGLASDTIGKQWKCENCKSYF